jgi:hypothetical protein
MNRRTTRTLAALAAAALVLGACGDDDDDDAGGTSAPSETTAGADTTDGGATTEATDGTDSTDGTAGGAIDLASVCPDPISIQTDWFPEAEHGSLYQMLGEEYDVDTSKKVVRGPLVANGQETGVEIEIRSGGPAIGFEPVSVQQYADDSITLGYANTEGQILRWTETPVISVVAPLEINPQIIFWDPETYPEVETLADLGEEGVTINVFPGGTFADVFVAEGIWSEDQVDPSYDGSPARFIAEDGRIAQQGFASAEPYNYEHVFEEWGKPVAFQLLHDAGFEVYSQTLSVRPDMLEELSPCLERFVPIVQQAAIDYINDPDRANAIIIDAVERFDDFWTYSEGLANFSVEAQRELGLVGNGPDGILGNMDEERIQGVIDQIRGAGLDVPDDLTAADLMTNEFIDESIGL